MAIIAFSAQVDNRFFLDETETCFTNLNITEEGVSHLHENRIIDQAAPPEKVLEVPTGAAPRTRSKFDQARAEHGPHLTKDRKDQKK